MIKSISNKTLLIAIAALVVTIGFFTYFDSKKPTRTFRNELVSLDSAAVTEILIYPKSTEHREVKLKKEGDNWSVHLVSGKTAVVAIDRIQNLIGELMKIKPMRLAAKKTSKWQEFQVDSTGTRVKVMERDKQVLDIIIGKFTFNQQQRTATSYVRLFEDSSIYAVNGFLEFTFNQEHNNWRDKTLLKTDLASVLQINFIYPDSSFTLTNKDGIWMLDDAVVDSTTVAGYISGIANTSGSTFVDDYEQSFILNPTYSLRVETLNEGTITLNAYVDSSKSVIHSSSNQEAYFDGAQGNLLTKLFVSRLHFAAEE